MSSEKALLPTYNLSLSTTPIMPTRTLEGMLSVTASSPSPVILVEPVLADLSATIASLEPGDRCRVNVRTLKMKVHVLRD